MIKFFRKIRQNQIMSNNTGKPAFAAGRYFKYAIGEIVLVVIGILIALQINNVNERHKANVYERKMLIEIRNALANDVVFFKNHLIGNRLQRIKKATLFFENYLVTDSIATDSIDYHYEGLNYGFQVTYNNGPFEALKSTGIDKLKNHSLRKRIIDLYEFQFPRYAGLINVFKEEYKLNSNKYAEELRGDLQIDIQDGRVNYNYNIMKAVDLKSNQSFMNLLYWNSSSYKTLYFIFNTLLLEMENLITALDREIETT